MHQYSGKEIDLAYRSAYETFAYMHAQVDYFCFEKTKLFRVRAKNLFRFGNETFSVIVKRLSVVVDQADKLVSQKGRQVCACQ